MFWYLPNFDECLSIVRNRSLWDMDVSLCFATYSARLLMYSLNMVLSRNALARSWRLKDGKKLGTLDSLCSY
jgi:hypothetical protein